MCGRFTVRTAPKVKLPGMRHDQLPFEPRYNIAPTQDVFVVADLGDGVELTTLSWGLIPAHSSDGRRFINARGETIETKPSFSESYKKRRCLILADGFCEWKRSGKAIKPYYIQMKDESPFAFAGIWDSWYTKERITACAIVTTAANETLKPIHHRMPVILTSESYESWLSPDADPRLLHELLAPFPAAAMSSHPVGRAVNSVQNDGPELIEQKVYEVGETFSLFDALNEA